jgi:hypothetical protein
MFVMFASIIRLSDAISHRHQTSFGVTAMQAYLYQAAKYQQVKGKKQIVQIQRSHRDIVHTIPVKGVREARKVATEYNATPWNF